MKRICLFWPALALLLPASGGAQEASDAGPRHPAVVAPSRPTDQSPTDPPGAFTRVEALRFAGVLALGGLAYALDEPARDALRQRGDGPGGAIDGLGQFAYYYGEPGVAVLGLGMWGTGLLTKRPTLAVSGFRAMEAVAVSGAVTILLKELAGRARPDVAPNSRSDWKFARTFGESNNDYQSMASGHATVSFAFATAVTGVVAERMPQHTRTVALTAYGLAAMTSWQRMYSDRHWLSDVTVGAGIGTVTALAIARWHATRPDNAIDRFFLRPVLAPAEGGGVRVGLSVVPR